MSGTGRAALLLVGPLPPPLDGTSVSFRIFCEEARSCLETEHVRVVDSSPRQLKEDNHRPGIGDVAQALRVLVPFVRQIRFAERVVVFGSNGFLLKVAPILAVIAQVFGRPFYIRPFGGSLDTFCETLPSILKAPLTSTLRRADGVIVQTRQLALGLEPVIGAVARVAPGYRPLPQNQAPSPKRTSTQALRLCYVGHIREEKGVLVLLDSLRRLRDEGDTLVHCDVYGPIYDSVRQQFHEVIRATPNASYRGVVSTDAVISTMQLYDALVFPSFYQGEGHPGVLVEAMMAGLPMIATDFRSVPELVKHEVNGLLVRHADPASLAAAIVRLRNDRTLLSAMAKKSLRISKSYDSRRVARMILESVGIPVTDR